jgi:predicted nucleotidyltransferase
MNQQVLEHIRTLKKEILPNDKLILFGSQARGDAWDESDWDLLILLNKPSRVLEDYDNYGYPFTELGWTMGKYFSPKIFTVSEWQQQSFTPFYKNVEHDGVEIV